MSDSPSDPFVRIRYERVCEIVTSPIDDDLDSATKNALALQNVASLDGRCPECGAEFGEIQADPVTPNLWYCVMQHEHDCPATLTGEGGRS